jgi:hypothetical protein
MSIGHDIIDEIGKQGMFAVAHPDPDEAHIFVWSSGAGEQLHALVMDSKEVRDALADARIEAKTLRQALTEMSRENLEYQRKLETELAALRDDKARLDAVLARGFPCSWIAPYDYFPQDPIKGRAAIDAARTARPPFGQWSEKQEDKNEVDPDAAKGSAS